MRGTSFKDGRLMWVGKFRHGRPVGHCWGAVQGDAWLYGTIDTSGRFTGPANAFIYPDLITVLSGDFKKDVMVQVVSNLATILKKITAVFCCV